MNAINTFCRCGGGNPTTRIPYAIMLSALMLIITIVLSIIDSSSWPFIFFVVTVIVVVISMIGTGVYNTSMFYVASMFPGQYTNAIVFGNVRFIFDYLIISYD
jgi:solute carrier family 29 (equilibrative nucleoside transporter), member 1/2/3